MTTEVDDFLEAFEKEAGPDFRRLGQMAGDAAMSAGMGALAAGAAGAASLAARKVYDAATHGRDFRTMLEYNPDLDEHRRRDEKLFNQHFTSLRNMNPSFSADPIVAGTFMRQMAENPANAGSVLREALSGRDKMPSLLGNMGQEAGASARESLKGSLKAPRQEEPGHAMGPLAGMARPRPPERGTFGSGSGRPAPGQRGMGSGGGGSDDAY